MEFTVSDNVLWVVQVEQALSELKGEKENENIIKPSDPLRKSNIS